MTLKQWQDINECSKKMAFNLKLRGKLIVVGIFVVGLAVLGSTLSLTWIVDTEMEQQVFDKIDALSANKRTQIEDYIGQIRNQVITFSKDRMIVDAVQKFSRAFEVLPNETEMTDQ